MNNSFFFSRFLPENRSKKRPFLFSVRPSLQTNLALIGLLLCVGSLSQAQVYYTLADGDPMTQNDQLRRINLDGTGDILIKSGLVNSAGPLVFDAANNRVLVADVRLSQSSTGFTNTKIVAVSLASGNAVSPLITPPYITGAASTIIGGLALDRINNYLYYTIRDGDPMTQNDQLRRINLDGTGDVLIKSGLVNSAGPLVLDAANNRVLVADVRLSQSSTGFTNTKIVAVSLASGNAVSPLITPPYITGAASTIIGGLALDRINNYLYYTIRDGDPMTQNDQLRRINLDGTGDILIKSGLVNSAGPLVLDAANNRVLVTDVRLSQSSTGFTNTKIVAVSLASGNAISPLITPPYITGASSTIIGGLTVKDQDPPTVTTTSITAFGSTTATLGGNVTTDGGVSVTERGVVYSSTNTNPTITTATKQQIGNGIGSFSQLVSGLAGNTTYYVRAYAINNISISYGDVQTFTTLIPNSPPTDITLNSNTVAENQPTGTTVGLFSTTDPNSGQSFSYSLVTGTGSTNNASFSIVGNQLRTNATFDFEAQNSYSIRVRTTDNGIPTLSFEKVFTISISNSNELTATISSKTDVSCGNNANGSASVTASGEPGPYTYTWTPGNPNGNGTSTVTSLTAGSYTVVVTATATGFSATAVVTINPCTTPDLTPILYARPSIINGTKDITVVVDIVELYSVASNGLITVKINKDVAVSLSFQGGATLIGGRSVQNNLWTFDNSDPAYYILTTNESIGAGNKLSFGLSGMLTPNGSAGTLSLSSVIDGTSGGEDKVNNNTDADQIGYLQY